MASPTTFALKPRLITADNSADIFRLASITLAFMLTYPALRGYHYPSTPPFAGSRSISSKHTDELLDSLADRPQLYGNDIDDSFTGLFNSSQNAQQILRAPMLYDIRPAVGNIPAIAIGAGPSLKHFIPQIRELQDRCLIIACDAVFHGLLDEGIEPHLVTPLERVPETVPMLTRGAETRTYYAGLPVVPPDAVKPFGDRCIGISCADKLYEWLWPQQHMRINSGLSTGVLAVSVACAITTGPVYLIGHDLCKATDSTHWGGAKYSADFRHCYQECRKRHWLSKR